MRAVRFNADASEELEAVVTYYEGRRPGLGALFLAEAKKARDQIIEQPYAGFQVSLDGSSQ